MKELYASRYLNVYPSKEKTSILFHGVTGAIDEVSPEVGKWLKSGQRAEEPLEKKFSDDVVEFLRGRGHISELDPEQELSSFKEYVDELHASICEQRKRSGFLMIVPSYYCNLACSYCYQNPMRAAEGKGATHVMSAETADRIFETILPQLYPDVDQLSTIDLNIYGGEPFLPQNRPALERVFAHTRERQMSVSAISNTTMLESYLPHFGCEIGFVNSIQVSFDGDKLHHDQSRITHYGEGTFDAIITNIHRLIDRGVQVNIRTNASKDNVESLRMLTDRLEEEDILGHPSVQAYAAAIHNHFDQSDPKPLFSPAVLSRKLEKLNIPLSSPLDKKVSRLEGIFAADAGIPLNRTNFCMQNMPNAYLIDHRQDIYSCYEEAGNRHLRVGYFDNASDITMLPRYDAYQSRNIAAVDPCSKCSVALTCGGGCPVAARGKNWHTGTIFTNHCDSHRELVAMGIQRLFSEKKQGNLLRTHKTDWAENQPYL